AGLGPVDAQGDKGNLGSLPETEPGHWLSLYFRTRLWFAGPGRERFPDLARETIGSPRHGESFGVTVGVCRSPILSIRFLAGRSRSPAGIAPPAPRSAALRADLPPRRLRGTPAGPTRPRRGSFPALSPPDDGDP